MLKLVIYTAVYYKQHAQCDMMQNSLQSLWGRYDTNQMLLVWEEREEKRMHADEPEKRQRMQTRDSMGETAA